MEGNVAPPAAAAAATLKGKPRTGASNLRLVRPKKKKSKEELKAEIKWIVPEQPYERIEARLLPKPVIPSRRYGVKLTDSDDKGEEVYVLGGMILSYIKYVRSCSHPKDIILHTDGGRGKLHQRVNNNRGWNNQTS